jgi:Mn-dependent DtxR family transcriptional regulator
VKKQKAGEPMTLQESGEMYLETIYILSKANNAVRSTDISEYMGYSKPSVSRAMGLLKTGGYIIMDEDNLITLTESGLAVAQKVFERHTIISNLLIRLGVPAEIASEDACKMEHVISDETFNAIVNHMNMYQ